MTLQLFDGNGVATREAARFSADFDGVTYDPARDHDRLAKQLGRVYEVMKDGLWRTLSQISEKTGDPEASVSARVRDLRKPKFGGYNIDRRCFARGIWEYRMRAA